MATRRRSTQSNRARRKRVWVRSGQNPILTGITPTHIDLLGTLGIINREPPVGATVGTIRYTLSVARTAGVGINDRVTCGILVGGVNDDADDHNPGVQLDLDWMHYRRYQLGEHGTGGVTGGVPALVENAWGDIEVGSMRRLEEYQQTLWFALVGGLAGSNYSVEVTASVMLILP